MYFRASPAHCSTAELFLSNKDGVLRAAHGLRHLKTRLRVPFMYFRASPAHCSTAELFLSNKDGVLRAAHGLRHLKTRLRLKIFSIGVISLMPRPSLRPS